MKIELDVHRIAPARVRAMHHYVASPYDRYPLGKDAAASIAAHWTADLLEQGFDVFSPIVHGHALQKTGRLTAHAGDHGFWLKIDERYMFRADACIVLMMDGWRQSKGVAWEREQFRAKLKPVFFLDPGSRLLTDLSPERPEF